MSLDASYRLKNGDKVALDIFYGNLSLGDAFFTVNQTTSDQTDSPGGTREPKVRGSSSNVDYTLTITSGGETALHFSSEPHMEEEDILAVLVYGEKFNALPAEDKAPISSWLN